MYRFKVVRDVRLGIKNLILHGLRSLLTMLGMVFGVASVIAMLAVGAGAGQAALEQIRQLGSDVILVKAIKPMADENQRQGSNFLSIYGITYADVQRVRETIPELKRVVPVKIRREQVLNRGRELSIRLLGTTADWFQVVSRPLLAGRALTALDEQQRKPVAVISERVARQLLALEQAVGSHLFINGNYYEVVGVVQSSSLGGGEIESPDQDSDVYVPLSTLREHSGDLVMRRVAGGATRESVELHQLLVQLNSEAQVEKTATALATMFRRFHTQQDVQFHVPLVLLRQAEQTQRTFNIVLGAIAGISLLVGGIGIMNIMLASVTERTREIGVRRAIGALRSQIISQFLVETVVLSSSGGLLGIAVGLLLPWAITRVTGLETVVTSASLVLSLLISMAIGIVFGLYPAIRASRLDPIVALRHE